MRAETKRRLAVFAVCALGVGCLYWVPEIASSPNQLSGQAPADQETRPRATVTMTATKTVRTPGESDDQAEATPDATSTEETAPAPGRPRTPVQKKPASTASRTDQATDKPASTRRQEPPRPSQVGNVKLTASDYDSLTVSWTGAENAKRYRVWLNGYAVETTSDTSATLDWFNSDDTHVVQIQAIDDDGDASRQSRALTLRRPAPQSPEPPQRPEGDRPTTETPTPEPTTPDRPDPSPESEDPTDVPDDEPTEEPTPSPTTPTPTPTTPSPSQSGTPDPKGIQSEEEHQQQSQPQESRTPTESPSGTPTDDASPAPGDQ